MKQKVKDSKIDYKAIALLHMAVERNKETTVYVNALVSHLKSKYPTIEDWIWESVLEGHDYKRLIERLEE